MARIEQFFAALCLSLTPSAFAAFEPLDMRWTFGNHEPVTMYRRVGNKTTGGIEGGALWLRDWHRWYDAEAPKVMARLGLNWTHSRFFKGLGWEEEKKDFPAVRKFVENCHAHGVKILAYVQFASLYHEKFALEVPDLADWGAYDAKGNHLCWHDQPFRWIPCMTSKPFGNYLKRMISIALTEGGFDGVMLDNVSSVPQCHCERCRRLFREHLRDIKDFGDRFGYENVDGLDAPPKTDPCGEEMDPLVQEWNRWQADNLTSLVRELGSHTHSVKLDAVFCGNVTDLRRRDAFRSLCLDVTAVVPLFDLILGQNGNVPSVCGDFIINRVRDLKFASALGVPDLALCDGDAGIAREDERYYLLPLLEDAIWGGVPTDRTVLTPVRGKGFVDEDLIAFRKPLLDSFNAFLASHREDFTSPTYATLGLWYAADGINVSDTNWRGVMGAEEILLRNHVPYRILVSRADAPAAIPDGCDAILVANQKCLSEKEIGALKSWVANGGRLVVTGVSGDSDEFNRQRWKNPFADFLERKNFRFRPVADFCAIDSGSWTYRVAAPDDCGKRLLDDLAKMGHAPPIRVRGLPSHVFVEFKRTEKGYAIHLLNYNPDIQVSGMNVNTPSGSKVRYWLPFDGGVEGEGRTLPTFSRYALVGISGISLRVPATMSANACSTAKTTKADYLAP